MGIWGFGSGEVCGDFGAVVPVEAAVEVKNANGAIAVAMVIDFRGFGLLVYLDEEDFLLIHYFSISLYFSKSFLFFYFWNFCIFILLYK